MPQGARRTQHARARSASLLQRGQHVLMALQPVASDGAWGMCAGARSVRSCSHGPLMYTERTRDVTLGTRRRAPVALHVCARGAAGRPRGPAGAPAAAAAAAQPAGGRAAAHVAAAAAGPHAHAARGGRAAGAPPRPRPCARAPARAGQPERAGGVLGGGGARGQRGRGAGRRPRGFWARSGGQPWRRPCRRRGRPGPWRAGRCARQRLLPLPGGPPPDLSVSAGGTPLAAQHTHGAAHQQWNCGSPQSSASARC